MQRNFRDLFDSFLGKKDDPDLFDYAGVDTKKLENKSPKKWIPWISMLVIAPAMFAAGRLSTDDECKLQGDTSIQLKNGERVKGFLEKLKEGMLEIHAGDSIYNIGLKDISRMELAPFSDDEVASNQVGGTNFVGRYNVDVGGHKGVLMIYPTVTGNLGGWIQFPHWGKGKIENLINVRIQGDKLLFLRSCQGAGCQKIGSPSPMLQEYFATINPEGTKIEGSYSGNLSGGRWVGLRVR